MHATWLNGKRTSLMEKPNTVMLFVVALAALIASACSSNPNATATPPNVSENDIEAAVIEHRNCMIDHGAKEENLAPIDGSAYSVTFGDNEFEVHEAAEQACKSILDRVFGEFVLSPEQEAENADRELRRNRCMTERRYPNGESPQPASDLISDMEAANRAFEDAFKECFRIEEQRRNDGS